MAVAGIIGLAHERDDMTAAEGAEGSRNEVASQSMAAIMAQDRAAAQAAPPRRIVPGAGSV
jgi:hypothetical protein